MGFVTVSVVLRENALTLNRGGTIGVRCVILF